MVSRKDDLPSLRESKETPGHFTDDTADTRFYGLYVGIVKNTRDSQHMGRLDVFIPDFGGDEDNANIWKPVSYSTPFGGSTPASERHWIKGKKYDFTLIYKNDIIHKVLSNVSMKNERKVNIKITKNIPWQAGLGSASTDAASVIKGLQKLSLINDIDNEFLTLIGADVPVCYYGQNCIATDIGNKINKDIDFPKYYFVLVYPYIHLSTVKMYSKIDEYLLFNKDQNNKLSHSINLNKKDKGNDFEKITGLYTQGTRARILLYVYKYLDTN